MNLKIYSIAFKCVALFCIFEFTLVFFGCAPAVLTSPQTSQDNTPSKIEESEQAYPKPSPRALAALQLTEQGRIFLENNQPDDAIGILERALNLNPDNGRNYFYLAEAWLMKGNVGQAAEFNRLAEIYFKNDSEWLYRVILQRERIKDYSQ